MATGRRLELDAMRGLMLVWITLTHLPTSASKYVNQPFGFISAAEGFIFLSALFTGRIYFRLAEHDGYRAMTRKMWGRTVRLYVYHALLLAFAFLVAVPIASRGNRPGLHNLLNFYFTAGPRQAITEAATADLSPAPARYFAAVHHLSGDVVRSDFTGSPDRMETDPVRVFRVLGAGAIRFSRRRA